MNPSSAPKFNIVVALDFSVLADRALEQALRLSLMHAHTELHVVVVGWPEADKVRLPGPKGLLLTRADAELELGKHVNEQVSKFHEKEPKLGLERIALYIADGAPGERICALAESVDADLVVLGTHGRQGLERWVLGSVAEEVVRRAGCGVFVVRPRDLLHGQELPRVEPPLKPGEHTLKPFHHAPTYHYVARGTSGGGRVMPIS